jgi:signal transduction histidine kinase
VTARFDARSIVLEVRDDGPGFSAEVLARLGEPYVTSRPGAEGSRTGHVGMGLGFFIAKTLLERTGGERGVPQRPPGGRGDRHRPLGPQPDGGQSFGRRRGNRRRRLKF